MRVKTLATIIFSILILLPCNAGAFAQPEGTCSTPHSTAIFWTDGPRLKALTITFFPKNSGPVGIVSVPVYACLGNDINSLTVAEYYLKYGRAELISRLEQLFDTPVETYIRLDQQSLVNISRLMGSVQMAGKNTNLVDVFEGRYADKPANLQVEIRQLAGAVTTPDMLIKLPRAIWIFATQVDTNIGPGQLVDFFRLLKNAGPEVLQKKAVPGHDYLIGGCKYRLVKPVAWVGTVREVTTRQ